MSETRWHIITSEYPPQLGGVSDYTRLVATGLAGAGDEVHVWCPAVDRRTSATAEAAAENPSEVIVHRDFGSFTPGDMRRVAQKLDRFPAPRTLLVQWVPHGYGCRSMNLPFCLWLWRRAKFQGDRVELMVHEPFLAFREGSVKQDLAAVIHRVMIVMLLNAATKVWVSTEVWNERLKPFLLGRDKSIGWLPVPSSIPIIHDAEGIRKTRAQYATNGTRLVGHFGAYNKYMEDAMLNVVPLLLNGENVLSILLLGKGSIELRDRLVHAHPRLSGNLYATGELPAAEISKRISACDVMLQPYQDGVSGRRSSVMTALEHGIPVVTTRGKATESCWIGNEDVKLIECADAHETMEAVVSFLSNGTTRMVSGKSGASLYSQRFALQHTIECLTQRQ